MRLSTPLILIASVCLTVPCQVGAGLVITEIVSKSEVTEDWFELTNTGNSPVGIAGWTYDDEGADLSADVAINGVASVAPGESIVVLAIDADETAEVAAFRAFWGGLSGVQIATMIDAAGLGKGDGVSVFDASEAIAAQQFYGDGDATDPGMLIDDQHAGVWAGGEAWDSANRVGGSWVGGSTYDGQYGIFASSTVNGDSAFEYASPGVAAVPEPASLALMSLASVVLMRRRRS